MAATPKQKSAGSKPKPKQVRKPKSAAELKAKLAKMQETLKLLEQRAYSGELEEAVKKTNIVESFNAIKASVTEATDIAILTAIGLAVGIKRVEVKQKAVAKRGPAKAKKNA